MKMMEYCHRCLRRLVDKVVALSTGNGTIISYCYSVIGGVMDGESSPPEVANKLLRYIREKTGVYDPFASIKDRELQQAREAIQGLKGAFPQTLTGLLQVSALGNSMDFFIDGVYDATGFEFVAEMDRIQRELSIDGRPVLIFADNTGEFLFDVGLIEHLERQGRKVYYAVKEHPVQNDLSMVDIERFHFKEICPNIISTGTGEVGIRREAMKGLIQDLWEGGATIIAKGMANYETLSEFNNERPVIHLMKVKCPTVALAVGKKVGQYIAIIGGVKNGN
jgi:hypothetical protein